MKSLNKGLKALRDQAYKNLSRSVKLSDKFGNFYESMEELDE